MSFNEWIESAKSSERAGNLAEAIVWYEKCLSEEPNDRDTLLSLSRLYLMTGRPVPSLEILLKNQILPRDKDYFVQISNTFMALNQFDEAEKVLKQAIAIKPESAILNNLGVVAIRRNRPEEAMEYFTESLRLDEKNVNTWFNLTTFYESQKDLPKAREVIEKALTIVNQVELLEKYIQILSMLGEHDKALEILAMELSKQPNTLILQVAKMRALFHAKKYDLCLEWLPILEERSDIPPNLKIDILDIKEKCYFFNQELGVSLDIVDQLLLLSNGNPGYEFRKAHILAVKRNFKESLFLLKQILERRNLPVQLQQDSLSLMKSIEIENWKSLVKYLLEETGSREMLAQNFKYLLDSRGILLPEEGVNYLYALVQQYKKKTRDLTDNPDL